MRKEATTVGQFAGTLFSMLLGWVQTAAAWAWGLITNAETSAWLRWLVDNWLPLTLALCIGGVAVDFIVYLIRWQPYRMWGRLLGRKDKEEVANETASPVYQRRWIYADGSTEVEDVHIPQQEPAAEEEHLDVPIRPVRRMARRATPEQAYNQPVYPPQWRHDQQGENE